MRVDGEKPDFKQRNKQNQISDEVVFIYYLLSASNVKDFVSYPDLVLGAFEKKYERRLLTSSCPSVCLSKLNNSSPTGRIFMKIGN